MLHLAQVDPRGLTDGERGRGLGAGRDVHLLRSGQLHGLDLRRLEDTWSSSGEEWTPRPAVAGRELDWAKKKKRKKKE